MSNLDVETPRETLERMGIAQVRILVSTGQMPNRFHQEALKFVAENDEADRAQQQAFLAEQSKIAQSAQQAAWIAAWAAIGALVIGILGVGVTIWH